MMRDLFGMRGITARRIYRPLVAIVLGAVVIVTSTTAAGWIQWNYSGYEGKANWTQYKQINDFLATLAPGRVMVEHGQKLDEFGTPRAFEIIPYWTGQPTMEGTLMEASFTAPFHFINQAELSKEASNAIIGVDYPGLDIPAGITHLQLMNIPYFLCFTPEVVEEVLADPRCELLATFGDYNVVRIVGTTGYVEVMKNEPVRVDVPVSEWRDMAVDWYLNQDALDTPIVRDQGEEALQRFTQITPEESADPPAVPINTEGRGDRRADGERGLLLRYDGHRGAALDQDLVLPQLARGGGGGSVSGVAVVHDGHTHPESRHPHLRPHGGQHRGADAGSAGLGAAGRAVGVALHPVAPAAEPGRGRARVGAGRRSPGARMGLGAEAVGAEAVGAGATSAAEPWDTAEDEAGPWGAPEDEDEPTRPVARGDVSEGQQYLWPDDRIAGADEEDVGGVVDEADRPGAGDEGPPSVAADAEEERREET